MADDQVIYLPTEDVGIVVLSNAFPIGLPEVLAAGFFDPPFEGTVTRDRAALYGQFYADFWQEIVDQYPVYPPPAYPAPARRSRPTPARTRTPCMGALRPCGRDGDWPSAWGRTGSPTR